MHDRSNTDAAGASYGSPAGGTHSLNLREEPFAMNNLGLMPTHDAFTKDVGWAIPIDTRTTLAIYPKTARTVARYCDGLWWPVVEHLFLKDDCTAMFNDRLALCATEWILGPIQDLGGEIQRKAQRVVSCRCGGRGAVAVRSSDPRHSRPRMAPAFERSPRVAGTRGDH